MNAWSLQVGGTTAKIDAPFAEALSNVDTIVMTARRPWTTVYRLELADLVDALSRLSFDVCPSISTHQGLIWDHT